jgi:hypothetical protein
MTMEPEVIGGAPEPPPDPEDYEWMRDPRARAWVGEHIGGLRQSAFEQGILYRSLLLAFVAGLIAHAVGFLLKSSATTEPLELIADLLYALGFALWTGVVVVLFVEVIPRAKERQIRGVLEAYEVVLRRADRAASAPAPRDD